MLSLILVTVSYCSHFQSTYACPCIPLANYMYTTTVQSMMLTYQTRNRFHTKFSVIISCLYVRYTHCTCTDTNNQHTRRIIPSSHLTYEECVSDKCITTQSDSGFP